MSSGALYSPITMTHTTNDLADLTFQRRDLRRALIACSSDPARTNLRQLRIESDGTVIATDGHRLHVLTDVIAGELPKAAVAIPGRLLELLLHATKGAIASMTLNVSVTASDGTGHVAHASSLDGLTMSERAQDAKTFPPYQQILNGLQHEDACTYTTTAKVLRAKIKASRDNTLSDVARDKRYFETAVVAMTSDGPSGDTDYMGPWVSADYLADTLVGLAAGEAVTIRWSDPLEPVEITASGIRAIVMPRRV